MNTRKLNRPRGLSLALLVLTSLVITPFAARLNLTYAQGSGAPANDNLAAATTLPVQADFSDFVGSTINATVEAGERIHGCSGCAPHADNNSSKGTIWVRWTAPLTGRVRFSTQGSVVPSSGGFGESPMDTAMAVYQGTGYDNLQLVVENDDDDLGGNHSLVNFRITQGQEFLIAIGSSPTGGGRGNVKLTWNAREYAGVPPANDDFAAAHDFGSLEGTRDTGDTNDGATSEPGEAKIYTRSAGFSVWYKWTIPGGTGATEAIVDTFASDFNTDLGVYTANDPDNPSVGALTRVARNDDADIDGATSVLSRVSFDPSQGGTYYVKVDGKNQFEVGRVGLNWKLVYPPLAVPFDDFALPRDISGTQGTDAADVIDFDIQYDEGERDYIASNYIYASAWYKWRAPATGAYSFDTIGSPASTTLAVHTGTSFSDLTVVPYGEGYGFDYDTYTSTTQVRFNAEADTDYYIQVGLYDYSGAFTLKWEPTVLPVPGNDLFANAYDINTGVDANGNTVCENNVCTGNNRYAGKEDGEPDHAGDAGGASIWYKWTATQSGKVFFRTQGEFSRLLAVYTGDGVGALTAIAQNNDDGGDAIFTAQAGATYRIAIDGRNGGTGDVTLTFAYDSTAPTTTAVPEGCDTNYDGVCDTTPEYYKTLYGEGYVSLQATDGETGIGVARINYTVTDDATGEVLAQTQDYESGNGASIFFAPRPSVTLVYSAVDGAGNVEAQRSLRLRYDTVKPTVTTNLTPARNPAGFTNGDTTLTLQGIDAESGIDHIVYSYKVPGASSFTQKDTYNTTSGKNFAVTLPALTVEGAYSISYVAYDKGGNNTGLKTIEFKLDKTAPNVPTAIASATPNASGYINGTNGAPKITLGASDKPAANNFQSGLAGYVVKVTKGTSTNEQFVPASAGAFVLPEGTSTVSFQSIDNAGNRSAATAPATYKVDATSPVTSYTVASSGRNITLTVNFGDNLSGYAAVTSSVNGGAPQTHHFQNPTTNGSISYTFNGPYNDQGDYTIRYYGTDAAGNREAEKSVTFRIPPAAITPFASAPSRNANGTYTVTFGYQNDNPTTFNIAIGASNFFSPNPQGRNQTTAFQPGRVANAFSVTWNGSRLTWTIKGPDGQTRSVSVR